MHKQDENDLEILTSFIRRHVKILWNQFFCICINLILTWILISAEKVYVFAKYTTLRMIRGRPFDLGAKLFIFSISNIKLIICTGIKNKWFIYKIAHTLPCPPPLFFPHTHVYTHMNCTDLR
jgi:hypothetical protein